jgi:hypothetical protein
MLSTTGIAACLSPQRGIDKNNSPASRFTSGLYYGGRQCRCRSQ